MARQNIEDDARFIECKRRLEPLVNLVAEERAEAQRRIEDAKRRVDNEMLAVVRYALEVGLSRYAIGRLTGKTRHADIVALVERAMAGDVYVPLTAVKPGMVEPEPEATPDMPAPDGWEFSDVAGDPGGPGASVTLSSPDGELFRMTVDDSDVRQYYDESDGHRLDARESLDRIPHGVDAYVKWLVYGPLGGV